MSHLLASLEGRVLRLTLDRPEKRNALDTSLCSQLVEALESAARDDSVGAILLQGNGKSFCAGMDLNDFGGAADLHERLFTIGYRLTTPIVAAVHGASLGGGTGLVANCHIVVAAPGATFGLTEIRLGLWPFLVFRACTAAMGERRALELALTGRIFPAAEARDIGLIHELSPDPQARAAEIAAQLASWSPTAIRRGLSFVHSSRPLDWQQAGALARQTRDEIFATEDFQSALRAFRERK